MGKFIALNAYIKKENDKTNRINSNSWWIKDIWEFLKLFLPLFCKLKLEKIKSSLIFYLAKLFLHVRLRSEKRYLRLGQNSKLSLFLYKMHTKLSLLLNRYV